MVGSTATAPHPPRRLASPWLNSHTTRSTCSPDRPPQSCAPATPQGACATSSDRTPAANGAQKLVAIGPGPPATTDESAAKRLNASARPPPARAGLLRDFRQLMAEGRACAIT